jgi:hypothetical protein
MADTVHVHDTDIVEIDRGELRWSAVIAGLVLMIALGWLFFLLGSALGVSIADATDAEAMGRGFGIAATLWLLLSALASFFFGGLLAGRLAGTLERAGGMLHGITLWGVGTALLMLLGYWGVTGILSTGQAVARTAADVGGAAAAAGAAGAAGAVQGAGAQVSGALDPLLDPALNRMKEALAARVAEASARGAAAQPDVAAGPPPVPDDAIQTAANAIAAGDTAAAEQALTAAGVPAEQARSVAQIVAAEPRVTTGEQGAAEIQGSLRSQLAMQPGGEADAPPVAPQEARQAIEQLEPRLLAQIAGHLVAGEEEPARQLLAAHTNLDEAEVDAVVRGLAAEARSETSELRREIAQTTETASTVTQAALWAAFLSGTLALLAAVAGGTLGANSTRRHYLRHHVPS